MLGHFNSTVWLTKTFTPDMVRNWMVICMTKIRTITRGMCNWILLHYPSNNMLYDDVIWLYVAYQQTRSCSHN